MRDDRSTAAAGKPINWKQQASAAAFLLALVLAMQWFGNGYRAEPLHNGDEAAHMVTGLMVHDYVTTAAGQNPMRYASNYYLHYPQVALGHWPPMLYVFQTAAMVVLSPSRTTLILLSGLLAALLCFRVFQVAARDAPRPAALAVAALLAVTPAIQEFSRMITAEMLLCWLMLEGTLALARWWEVPSWPAVALYAVLAIAALLTKVTGVSLAFAPLVAILLTRRFRLLLSPQLWAAGAAVVLICGPWYAFAPGARHEAVTYESGWAGAREPGRVLNWREEIDEWVTLIRRRTRDVLKTIPALAKWLGPGILLVAMAGWRRMRAGDPIALAALSMAGGFLILRMLIKGAAEQDRLVLPALAPVFLLIWHGCRLLASWTAPATVLAVWVGGMGVWSAYSAVPKQLHGIQEVAAALSARQDLAQSVFFVSGGTSEGAFIAEMAIRDKRRPRKFVLRSGKMMASSDWGGHHYQARVTTSEDTLAMLRNAAVAVVVVDRYPWPQPIHMAVLQRTIAEFSSEFQPLPSPGDRFLLYELKGHRSRPKPKFTIDLRGLGGQLNQE